MKTICKFGLSLALLFSLFLCNGYAQEKPAPKIFHLETKDGNGYTGEVLYSDTVKVLFKVDKLGELTILQKDIKSLESIEKKQLKDGTYWLPNPQSTRYFFSPNGYGLKKGEGYYQNIWVVLNSFAIGLNDYISLGGGLVPAFLFGEATPAWVTAKISVPVVRDKLNLGAGVLAGTALGGSDDGYGIFYGLATIGSRDKNLTVGMGYAFASDSETSAPMFNLNGMFRVGPKGYLVTENYLFFDGSSIAMLLALGGRTIIKGAGLDYGLVIPLSNEMDSFFAIPWLGITIPIGKRGAKNH